MMGSWKEIVAPGEIASRIVQLVSSEQGKAPTGNQVWTASKDACQFDVALKCNGNGPGSYRLTIAGDPDIRNRVITDFQACLGEYSGPFQLPSGSSKIATVFWDANQVIQNIDNYFAGIL